MRRKATRPMRARPKIPEPIPMPTLAPVLKPLAARGASVGSLDSLAVDVGVDGSVVSVTEALDVVDGAADDVACYVLARDDGYMESCNALSPR
jgi:hypothetical protein